jgi:hypothetical protein
MATGYWLHYRVAGVRVLVRSIIVLLRASFRPALGPVQSPLQWISGIVSMEIKRQEREAPSNAQVTFTSTLPNALMV